MISFGEEGEETESSWEGWLSGKGTVEAPHLSLLEDFIGLSRGSGRHHRQGWQGGL